MAASADIKMSKALQIKAGKTDSSKGSIHAYVVFADAETAEAAHALNMTEFKGNHIRVDRAAAPKEDKSAGNVHYDARRSVFVGNLPRDVSVWCQSLRCMHVPTEQILQIAPSVKGSIGCIWCRKRT